MKITPDHLKHMSEQIKPLDTAELRAQYQGQGLTPRRYRWDLTYSAPGMTKWICDTIYPYADDTHLDTALRAIVCNDKWEPAPLAR